MDGVDRPTWEAFVFSKEELEDFLVGISTIGKQSDNARDEFVRCALFRKECFRNFFNAVIQDTDQLVLTNLVENSSDWLANALSVIRNGKKVFSGREDRTWNNIVTHPA